MSDDSKFKKAPKAALRFAASFDEQPEQEIPVVAYAFDRSGKLLASAPVKEGQSELKLPAGIAPHARVFYAPAPPEEGRKPVQLADMERLRAYELGWRFDPEVRRYEVLPVPRPRRSTRWCPRIRRPSWAWTPCRRPMRT